MAYPKWKYRINPIEGGVQSTLVGTAEAEEEIGDTWIDDPTKLGVYVVPCGGPHDASGRVGFGPAPVVPGVTKARVGG
jgi:hypothetical protein